MPLIGDEVKRQAEALIGERQAAISAAESEGPKYVGWLGRVQLLVDRLGPEGATFANELRRLRNADTWAGRLAAANAMRGGAMRQIRQNAANTWIAEAVGGEGGLLASTSANLIIPGALISAPA